MTFWVAGAVVVGGIASSVIGSKGQSAAAETQANASDRAAELQYQQWTEQQKFQREQWEASQANQKPWLTAGTNALAQMQEPGNAPAQWKNFTMADYQADPGYAFRMSEGLKAMDRSAAARGGLLSGATLKGAQRFGQDLASQEYGAAYSRYNQDQMNTLARGDMGYNRLASMAGIGQTSASNMASGSQSYANAMMQGGQNYANQAGAGIMASGQAQAAGQMGSANTWANAINSGVGMYQQQNLLGQILNRNPGGYNGQMLSNTPSWSDSMFGFTGAN